MTRQTKHALKFWHFVHVNNKFKAEFSLFLLFCSTDFRQIDRFNSKPRVNKLPSIDLKADKKRVIKIDRFSNAILFVHIDISPALLRIKIKRDWMKNTDYSANGKLNIWEQSTYSYKRIPPSSCLFCHKMRASLVSTDYNAFLTSRAKVKAFDRFKLFMCCYYLIDWVYGFGSRIKFFLERFPATATWVIVSTELTALIHYA